MIFRDFELFSSWPQSVMQQVAEESRSIEYRNDTVIDNNLLQTDMVYVLISVSGNLFIISFDRWNFFI